MAKIGLFLSSEEHGPRALLEQAHLAESAGMSSVFISDHFHPWIDRQGESPFVWSTIGAIGATTRLEVMTGVTCPIMRIHPVVLAQAAATSQLLLEGRFIFGVGSGEALNEHITGQHWPSVGVRLEMLEEAIEVMRELWSGQVVDHRGAHFTVQNARIYSTPDEPPPVFVSAFGPRALEVATRVGDGLVTTRPDGGSVRAFKDRNGGECVAALKVCWGSDEASARRLAHQLWPTEGLSGQLSQELPMPAHFAEVCAAVSEDMVAAKIPCGPDPERHLKAIKEYLDAGFDRLYISQIGSDIAGFLRFFTDELAPELDLD